MTSRTLTLAERAIRQHALAINLGYCTWCRRQATNACHRLPEGQQGPYIAPNLLPGCGSGSHGCHWRTEQHRALSYACGWLIKHRDGETPAQRSTRIAATPALIRTQLGAGWHILDFLLTEDDEHGRPRTRPAGMPRLAEPDEVPSWMYQGTYEQALGLLHGKRAA